MVNDDSDARNTISGSVMSRTVGCAGDSVGAVCVVPSVPVPVPVLRRAVAVPSPPAVCAAVTAIPLTVPSDGGCADRESFLLTCSELPSPLPPSSFVYVTECTVSPFSRSARVDPGVVQGKIRTVQKCAGE